MGHLRLSYAYGFHLELIKSTSGGKHLILVRRADDPISFASCLIYVYQVRI